MDSLGNFGKSFGVMQGRLSKQTGLGYQAFPMENWKNEFQIAEKLGLQHIEWIFDKHSPLMCVVITLWTIKFTVDLLIIYKSFKLF